VGWHSGGGEWAKRSLGRQGVEMVVPSNPEVNNKKKEVSVGQRGTGGCYGLLGSCRDREGGRGVCNAKERGPSRQELVPLVSLLEK